MSPYQVNKYIKVTKYRKFGKINDVCLFEKWISMTFRI